MFMIEDVMALVDRFVKERSKDLIIVDVLKLRKVEVLSMKRMVKEVSEKIQYEMDGE
jgi:hypothetical protein